MRQPHSSRATGTATVPDVPQSIVRCSVCGRAETLAHAWTRDCPPVWGGHLGVAALGFWFGQTKTIGLVAIHQSPVPMQPGCRPLGLSKLLERLPRSFLPVYGAIGGFAFMVYRRRVASNGRSCNTAGDSTPWPHRPDGARRLVYGSCANPGEMRFRLVMSAHRRHVGSVPWPPVGLWRLVLRPQPACSPFHGGRCRRNRCSRRCPEDLHWNWQIGGERQTRQGTDTLRS